MAKLISMLMGALAAMAGPIVGRVLIALGISYVTFKGYDLTIGWLLDQVKGDLGAMPAETLNFFAYMWVDKALSMIFSAYTAALAVKVAGGTGLTKMVTKGKA